MPISFDKEKMTFKLDSATSSYIIKIYDEGYILNKYYGASIPETFMNTWDFRPANASFSPFDPVIGECAFTPDTAPIEYGCNGSGDFRISALSVRNSTGDTVTDIRYKSHKIYKGKPAINSLPSTYVNSEDEADTLELCAEDAVTGALVTLYYTVFSNCGVMTRRVKVTNGSKNEMAVERVMSLCMDLPSMDYDMISLYGRHCKERYVERRPLVHGIQGVESTRGASGHVQNPFIVLAEKGSDEEKGWVYGFNLVYSGNFSAIAECDVNDSTRLIMGINPTDFEWHLEPGESFETPEAVMVFTTEGIGEMSRIFHRFYNNNLVRGPYKIEKRPLLINSWEAAYFDFDDKKLVEFAKVAKDLGIEMLVMDDGWFGKRNDDHSSLGDWFVNEEKLKGGLTPLIKQINDLGLKFGIWYEPEMISPDSELYRQHRDWCVRVEGREPKIARHQYVIDFSRKDVRDNIWQQMYKVLSENKIDYIKWDFNRNISDAGSALLPPERKKEFFHRFIMGTYEIMDRLVTAFPNILFESCSGGGGRFDPAMLYYSPQIWASDNTDPLERLYIQFGTSMCYPASCVGAHVSANGRTSFKTNGNVALWGTFGYELDPRKLTPEQLETAKKQIKEYHERYELMRRGDLYRLISPFENRYRAVWELVSPDKAHATVTLVTMSYEQHPYKWLRLRGLDPDKKYLNSVTGEIYSGRYLMNVGILITAYARGTGDSEMFDLTAVE